MEDWRGANEDWRPLEVPMTDDPRAAAFEQALKQLEAWQTANDEAFEWCDYDMEIEASKRAFAIAAALLKASAPACPPHPATRPGRSKR